MAINFRGYLYDDSGTAIQGATVQLLEQDGDQEASTTTDSNGLWYFNEADQDTYDIKITRGSSIRYIQWDDQISLKEIDVRNDSAATTPALTATNLTNSTANQVAVFSGANSTRADGDEIYLSFKLANSAGDIEEFARMTADAVDVTDGSEDGQIRFGVSVGGTMTDVFTINSTTAGSTDMTLDVSGDLTLDADGGDILFKDGGTTFGSATNTSGNLIIKSGTTTALTFSGANVTAAGTIGSGAITSTGIVTGTGFTAGNAVLAEAELELLDGLTAGTAIASKVVTTDANIDTTGQRNLTITGELDAATLDISGNADIDGTLEADVITVDGTSLAEYIADTVGAMVTSNTESGITVAYQDSDNTLDFTVGTLNQDTTGTASLVTVTDSTANTNFPVVFHNESNGLLDDTGALRYNPSTGELLVPKLTVAGTTTTADTVTMQASNAVIFEGATADAHETTLSIVDPTSDHTQYLVNQGGYIPVLAAATTTQISSTPEELNILDGATVVVGEINALDLGSTAVGTAIASKAVILDSNKDYDGIRNLTITGELDGATLDISGNADIDGTTNLDAVDIDGAVQLDATLTVGANDQGYDIIFYGDTASANVTWDTSADDLIFNGGAGLIVPDGQFTLGSTAVGSTAAELNLLDGSAKSTSSITIADADAFVVIDGTTTKQIPASDIKTYASSATAADDIATGDGAVNIVTTSGNITIDAQANDTDVIIKVDDNGSSVTAVTFDGSDEGNAIFVNDVQLKSDGALLEFGADLDTTLTHTDGTGLTLNSTNKLAFGDTGTFIHQSSDGVLTIESDTTVDINGAVVLNGAVTGATNITLSGELDAATLDISGNADIDGTLETDNLTIGGSQGSDGQVLTSTGSGVAWEAVAAGGDVSLAAENLTEGTTSSTSVTNLMTVGTDVNCDNDKMGFLTFLWRHDKDADDSGSQNSSYTYFSMDIYFEGSLASDVMSLHRPDNDLTSVDLVGSYQIWFNPASTSYGSHASSSSYGHPRWWGHYTQWRTDANSDTNSGHIIPAYFSGYKANWSASIDKVTIKGKASNTDTTVGVDQALFYVFGG